MNSLRVAIVVGLLSAFNYSAPAAIYNDATGENFTGAGGGILDISSVEVTDTATDLIFKINLTGPIANPNDWGNYMVGIDSVVGGDTAAPVGNPWNRPITMSSGMDYWLGSWVNGGGGSQIWNYTTSWSGPVSGGISLDTSSLTITAPLLSLGLSAGQSFNFDVYSSGADGNPGAIDALANPNQTINDWGVAYDSGSLVYTYTVTPIPEPSALALIGLGGAVLARRLIRRKA